MYQGNRSSGGGGAAYNFFWGAPPYYCGIRGAGLACILASTSIHRNRTTLYHGTGTSRYGRTAGLIRKIACSASAGSNRNRLACGCHQKGGRKQPELRSKWLELTPRNQDAVQRSRGGFDDWYGGFDHLYFPATLRLFQISEGRGRRGVCAVLFASHLRTVALGQERRYAGPPVSGAG